MNTFEAFVRIHLDWTQFGIIAMGPNRKTTKNTKNINWIMQEYLVKGVVIGLLVETSNLFINSFNYASTPSLPKGSNRSLRVFFTQPFSLPITLLRFTGFPYQAPSFIAKYVSCFSPVTEVYELSTSYIINHLYIYLIYVCVYMTDSRWSWRVLEWGPRNGQRSVVRPPARWTYDLTKVANVMVQLDGGLCLVLDYNRLSWLRIYVYVLHIYPADH